MPIVVRVRFRVWVGDLRLRHADSLVITAFEFATRVFRLKENWVGSAPDAREWTTLITSLPWRERERELRFRTF